MKEWVVIIDSCLNCIQREIMDVHDFFPRCTLSYKKPFLTKIIWEGKRLAKTWVTCINMKNDKKSIENSSLLYHIYTPILI